MEKNIPNVRERERNENFRSHISGMGIRGYHSQEYTGTGAGMKKTEQNNKKIFSKYVEWERVLAQANILNLILHHS